MNATSRPGGLQRFRHIVIEGPIGVGKTSLARKLGAYLGAELLLEQAQANPFLRDFYGDMSAYAFQTQVFFLLQRLKQIRHLVQPEVFGAALVSDFLFAKDALFARLNLSDDEFRLYVQMQEQLAPKVPEPDLVIWLQALPATLMLRIQQRAIGMEQGIALGYLQRLCEAYAAYFQSHHGAPVLMLNTEHFNPIKREADFAQLLDLLSAFTGPREAFGFAGDPLLC
jgi:deoxyguanosine kinase